jgi:hypothetical protein
MKHTISEHEINIDGAEYPLHFVKGYEIYGRRFVIVGVKSIGRYGKSFHIFDTKMGEFLCTNINYASYLEGGGLKVSIHKEWNKALNVMF